MCWRCSTHDVVWHGETGHGRVLGSISKLVLNTNTDAACGHKPGVGCPPPWQSLSQRWPMPPAMDDIMNTPPHKIGNPTSPTRARMTGGRWGGVERMADSRWAQLSRRPFPPISAATSGRPRGGPMRKGMQGVDGQRRRCPPDPIQTPQRPSPIDHTMLCTTPLPRCTPQLGGDPHTLGAVRRLRASTPASRIPRYCFALAPRSHHWVSSSSLAPYGLGHSVHNTVNGFGELGVSLPRLGLRRRSGYLTDHYKYNGQECYATRAQEAQLLVVARSHPSDAAKKRTHHDRQSSRSEGRLEICATWLSTGGCSQDADYSATIASQRAIAPQRLRRARPSPMNGPTAMSARRGRTTTAPCHRKSCKLTHDQLNAIMEPTDSSGGGTTWSTIK